MWLLESYKVVYSKWTDCVTTNSWSRLIAWSTSRGCRDFIPTYMENACYVSLEWCSEYCDCGLMTSQFKPETPVFSFLNARRQAHWTILCSGLISSTGDEDEYRWRQSLCPWQPIFFFIHLCFQFLVLRFFLKNKKTQVRPSLTSDTKCWCWTWLV